MEHIVPPFVVNVTYLKYIPFDILPTLPNIPLIYAFPTLPQTFILLMTYFFTSSLPAALYFLGSIVSGFSARYLYKIDNDIKKLLNFSFFFV